MVEFYKSLKGYKPSLIGIGILAILACFAIFAPFIAPYDPLKGHLSSRLEPPSAAHLFGTDALGRDLLSRVIYGARTSLRSGALVVMFSSIVGVFLGVISGYCGKLLDTLIMRFADFLLSFPPFLLAMGIVATLGPSLNNAIIAVAISYIGPLVRLVRGITVRIKEQEYIEAARAAGGNNWRIIIHHILPNIISPLLVQISLNFGTAIVDIAGLSFIGLGAQPPTPEWGTILSRGRYYIRTAWWLTTFPGLAIVATVLAWVFIGDGVREAIDPRYRKFI